MDKQSKDAFLELLIEQGYEVEKLAKQYISRYIAGIRGIDLDETKENTASQDQLVQVTSRSHLMEPTSHENLQKIIQGFNKYNVYLFCPAEFKDKKLHPIFKSGLIKKKLYVRDAEEITKGDIDSAAML
jgi:hypothetical protein